MRHTFTLFKFWYKLSALANRVSQYAARQCDLIEAEWKAQEDLEEMQREDIERWKQYDEELEWAETGQIPGRVLGIDDLLRLKQEMDQEDQVSNQVIRITAADL